MNNTRERMLRAIKARGQATIAELADALEITPVSVRHHLASLHGEGLVQSAEVRHGVGRPHLAYSLTDAAQERFPARYVRLSERLLDELKASLPAGAIEVIFGHMAEGMVAQYAPRLEGKSLDQKLELLIELLGAEGFMAEWNRVGETIWLTEYSCPYLRIGQRHPEVCAIDQTVIQQVLDASVQKTDCVLDGAERCVYVITPKKAAPVTIGP